MTVHRRSYRLLGGALGIGALVLAAGAWRTPPSGTGAAGSRYAAIVWLKQVGIVRASAADSAAPVRILVYATGPARIGLDGADPTPLTDTLRLSSLPTLAADVSEADVHVRLLSPGRLKVAGDITGGRAIHLTATGRHLVLLRGGVGATTVTDAK
jgi:hypothetical protein